MDPSDRRSLEQLAEWVADAGRELPGEGAKRRRDRARLGEMATCWLHARLARGLQRFFLRVSRGDEGLASTLAEETFARLWDRLVTGGVDPARVPIGAYARGIAAKVWLSELESRGAHSEQEPADRADPQPSPEVQRTCRELLADLRDCRTTRDQEWSLDERERTVVEGVLAGRGVHDLGAELGRDPAAVSRAKGSAIRKLRKCLERKGYQEGDLEAVFAVGGSWEPEDTAHG